LRQLHHDIPDYGCFALTVIDEIDAQFIDTWLKRGREKNLIFPRSHVHRGGNIKVFLLLKSFYLINGHLHKGIRHGTDAVYVYQDPIILVPGITDFRGDTTGEEYEKDTEYIKEWSVLPFHDSMVKQ
jgi:hypothetical protein